MEQVVTQEQLDNAFKTIALEAVKAFIAETGMDKIDQKYLMFPTEDEKELEKKSINEKFGILCKALVQKDYVKANTISSVEAGGYLLPEQVQADIYGLMPTYGEARKIMRVMDFPENASTVRMFKRGNGVTVYYPNDPQELQSITASDLTLTTFTLSTKKAVAGVAISNELLDFAIINFANYVKERAAEAFAMDEDSKVFSNVNTPFTGLFYPSNSYGSSVAVNLTSITYDTLNELIFSLPQNYLRGAAWLMHRTVAAKIRGIKDSNGLPIFMPANTGGLPQLLGYPVLIIESAPSNPGLNEPYILLGNFNNSFLYQKTQIKIATSGEATFGSVNTFAQDAFAIRFVRHWGFNPGLVEAYAAVKMPAA